MYSTLQHGLNENGRQDNDTQPRDELNFEQYLRTCGTETKRQRGCLYPSYGPDFGSKPLSWVARSKNRRQTPRDLKADVDFQHPLQAIDTWLLRGLENASDGVKSL